MNSMPRALSMMVFTVGLLAHGGRLIAQAAPATPAPSAQTPPGPGGRTPRPAFSVSTTAFPDGGEVQGVYTARGGSKSPAFEFHWTTGANTPVATPETVQSYAVIFHDVQNLGGPKSSTDTLHWTAFNIPGTAKGLPEGLGAGDLADGTRNGPGLSTRGGKPGAYYGPGAGVGPLHHYVFEFYALDTKLDLPATTTRDELVKAMDGHVISKAAWFGLYHATPQ